MTDRTCSIDGCGSKIHARGWCSRHYGLWRHKGDPLASATRHYASPSESLDARTEWRDGCRIWTGYTTNLGYGMIAVAGSVVMVHRFAWESANGPIPDGMEIDHTCWNRACCAVEHLRLAEHSENGRNRDGASTNSKTGIRNVSIENGRYKVCVGDAYIGMFDDLDAAVAVAEEERNARFGDFAGRG